MLMWWPQMNDWQTIGWTPLIGDVIPSARCFNTHCYYILQYLLFHSVSLPLLFPWWYWWLTVSINVTDYYYYSHAHFSARIPTYRTFSVVGPQDCHCTQFLGDEPWYPQWTEAEEEWLSQANVIPWYSWLTTLLWSDDGQIIGLLRIAGWAWNRRYGRDVLHYWPSFCGRAKRVLLTMACMCQCEQLTAVGHYSGVANSWPHSLFPQWRTPDGWPLRTPYYAPAVMNLPDYSYRLPVRMTVWWWQT